MKRCSKCKVDKPLAAFSRNRSRVDGLQDRCKDCNRADYLVKREAELVRLRKRYAESGEEMRAQMRAHYAANREAVRARQNAAIDPVANRARVKAWREANPERKKAMDAAYHAANRDRILEQQRDWREANRERKREADRRWRVANPSKRREYSLRYIYRKLANWVEDVDRGVVLERDAGICQICHGPVDPARWHLDHIVPLSRGGEHSYANTRVTHPACNQSKGDRDLAKLTAAQVTKIRAAHARGTTNAALAKQFGVSRPTISLIVNDKIWKP